MKCMSALKPLTDGVNNTDSGGEPSDLDVGHLEASEMISASFELSFELSVVKCCFTADGCGSHVDLAT